MARYSIDGQILTGLADVIRESNGVTRIHHEKQLTSQTGEAWNFNCPNAHSIKIIISTAEYLNGNTLGGLGACEGTISSGDWLSYRGNYLFQVTNTTGLPFEYICEGINTISVGGTGGGSGARINAVIDIIGLDKNGNELQSTFTPMEMLECFETVKPPAPILLTGKQTYGGTGQICTAFIQNYGDRISTHLLSTSDNMFSDSSLERIPFALNYGLRGVANNTIANTFYKATKLKEVPAMNNCRTNSMNNLFYQCESIRNIPEDLCDTWDWTYIDNLTSGYSGNSSSVISSCYSLRNFPRFLFEHGNPNVNYSYSVFSGLLQRCYVMDEAIDVPNPHKNVIWTSNAFGSSPFNYACRLKNLTFQEMEPVNWKSQIIDLSSYTGYGTNKNQFIGYNSGITEDKEVKDDATYQALKDDPDWFTTNVAYSRYNHDSAVTTINSLPDTSAYLATAGGTNTIKFKGAAGEKTDGGAINTLTEEEIAVATAKGWTVTLV
jgi:hypothetical protein